MVDDKNGDSLSIGRMKFTSHVLPGLQEAAVEKFGRIFEVDFNENSGPNVSKMLANGGG